LAAVLVAIIGLLDHWLGFEYSLLTFYFLPVVLGTVALDWGFGIVIAVASVMAEICGDLAAGAGYTYAEVSWRTVIMLSTYLVVVWLFATILTLQRDMQARVRQRTAALTAEIAERERLEKVLLEVSERERTTIGRELHDNLGQHLTGTAFAGQVLGEKLQALGLAEQADAWKLVSLIEEGIEKTRHLSKGLFLEEIQQAGLVTALQDLAEDASTQYRILCEFRLVGVGHITDSGASGHLLRIAQEAVRNALRHGKASRIAITLTCQPDCITLSVRDNGTGLSPLSGQGNGLGLRIMAHRAQIMNGEFRLETPPEGGTLVHCRLPQANSTYVH